MADEDNENTAPSGPPGVSDFDASQFADPAKNFQRRKFLGFSPLLSQSEQDALAEQFGLTEAVRTLVCRGVRPLVEL
jgi:hypothetical protein